MKNFVALVAAAVIVTASLSSCASAPAPSGTQIRSMEIDGTQREYRVHVPSSLAADPILVVMMHGGFGSAAQAESAYGWNALADAEGFIVAYPSGSGLAWNAGSCCGKAAANEVDDVAFIAAMVGSLQHEFDIAADHSFATGMSNGAMMAYRLACETELFGAIAPVAGTIVSDCDSPAPTSVLHIHGLADERVRFDGETGSGATRVDGLAVDDDVALWREVDDCAAPEVTVSAPVTTESASCADGRRVTLITVADAGHQWPGASGKGLSDPDAVSQALDATTAIWQFFTASVP